MRNKDRYEIYPITMDGSYIPIGDSYIFAESFQPTYNVKKIFLKIIEFFTINGPNPAYAMAKGTLKPRKRGRPPEDKRLREPKRNAEQALNYHYKTALRHAKKLQQMGLLRQIRPKSKNLLSLTFRGFHVHMRDPNRNSENLSATIKSNYHILPFSHYWDRLIEFAGEKFVHECLAKAISETIFKQQFEIADLDLNIDLLYIHPGHKPIFKARKDEKSKTLLEMLSTAPDLKNSYVKFLVNHDILSLIIQKKWPKTTDDILDLESEKALAFFEKRPIQEKLLFMHGKQLMKFLKKYHKLEYFFTGIFVDKLLSKDYTRQSNNQE